MTPADVRAELVFAGASKDAHRLLRWLLAAGKRPASAYEHRDPEAPLAKPDIGRARLAMVEVLRALEAAEKHAPHPFRLVSGGRE